VRQLKYNTVLFDLDGTLIDTNELIISSFLYTLDKFYPGRYRREDILPHMGKILPEQMAIFDPDNVEALVETYREHNIRMHDQMVREFPHVADVVKELDRHGVTMGIVTSKQITTTMMGLELFGLKPYMKVVVAHGDTKEHKPHPAPVLLAMEKLKADPAKTIMVGDSTYDIDAAHAAGIAGAAVRWSLKPESLLLSTHPEYMLTDMRELLQIVGISYNP
jgi:pyrophosphatase PpaX